MEKYCVADCLDSFGQLDVDAASVLVEVDAAVDFGVDGVILTHVDVCAWVPLSSALADDDVAGDDFFAAELFHAETFAA